MNQTQPYWFLNIWFFLKSLRPSGNVNLIFTKCYVTLQKGVVWVILFTKILCQTHWVSLRFVPCFLKANVLMPVIHFHVLLRFRALQGARGVRQASELGSLWPVKGWMFLWSSRQLDKPSRLVIWWATQSKVLPSIFALVWRAHNGSSGRPLTNKGMQATLKQGGVI